MSRRKPWLVAGGLIMGLQLALTGLPLTLPNFAFVPVMNTMNGKGSTLGAEAEVQQATAQFYAALNAMFNGEMGPMDEVWSHAPEATDMSPFGGRATGWDQVRVQFARAAQIKPGGRVIPQDLLVRVSGELAYSICTEQAENMSAEGKQMRVSYRATNIFRREGGRWKLVHHHTDLAPGLQAAIGH